MSATPAIAVVIAAGSAAGVAPGSVAPGSIWTFPGPPPLPTISPGPIASMRTGLATLRCRSVITWRSDQFRPIANVAAATPTTRAPSIIDARTGWASPAEIPSRPGRPTGAARPSRRRRPPSGRIDGAAPRVIASTGLIRPARSAGTSAASRHVARARPSTPTTTGADRLKAVGSPNDRAVSWTTGWLAMVPMTTPMTEPTAAGASTCPPRTRLTWRGVYPTAFITPMSR